MSIFSNCLDVTFLLIYLYPFPPRPSAASALWKVAPRRGLRRIFFFFPTPLFRIRKRIAACMLKKTIFIYLFLFTWVKSRCWARHASISFGIMLMLCCVLGCGTVYTGHLSAQFVQLFAYVHIKKKRNQKNMFLFVSWAGQKNARQRATKLQQICG